MWENHEVQDPKQISADTVTKIYQLSNPLITESLILNYFKRLNLILSHYKINKNIIINNSIDQKQVQKDKTKTQEYSALSL